MNIKSLNFEHIIIIVLILIIGFCTFKKNNENVTNEPTQLNSDYKSCVKIENCKFVNLPLFYDVYAVASYEGLNPIGVIIDKNGNRNASNDVIVNVKNKPIVLVLTSYEPVVWNIKSTQGTKIAGVVLGGYYNQALLGISKNIPVLNYTYTQNNCGHFYLSNRLDSEQVASIQKIQEVTGKKPTDIKYQYNGGTFFVGNPVGSTDKLIYSDDYKLSDYQVNLNTVSGSVPTDVRSSSNWKEDATVYLVTHNYLKQATIIDIQNWENKARAPYLQSIGGSASQMQIQHDMSPDHTYIVQKSFKIPDDFCYGHFINFIIPNGVQAPENKQNCGFYFLKDGSKL